MAGKKILLTLNPEMFEILEQKAKGSFMTMQELITDTLRKDIINGQKRKANKKCK